jgi:hypothetical protein
VKMTGREIAQGFERDGGDAVGAREHRRQGAAGRVVAGELNLSVKIGRGDVVVKALRVEERLSKDSCEGE